MSEAATEIRRVVLPPEPVKEKRLWRLLKTLVRLLATPAVLAWALVLGGFVALCVAVALVFFPAGIALAGLGAMAVGLTGISWGGK